MLITILLTVLWSEEQEQQWLSAPCIDARTMAARAEVRQYPGERELLPSRNFVWTRRRNGGTWMDEYKRDDRMRGCRARQDPGGVLRVLPTILVEFSTCLFASEPEFPGVRLYQHETRRVVHLQSHARRNPQGTGIDRPWAVSIDSPQPTRLGRTYKEQGLVQSHSHLWQMDLVICRRRTHNPRVTIFWTAHEPTLLAALLLADWVWEIAMMPTGSLLSFSILHVDHSFSNEIISYPPWKSIVNGALPFLDNEH